MPIDIFPVDGMLQTIKDLTDQESIYTARDMVTWASMRAQFKADRQRLRLTQGDVAAKSGVSQGTISRIENDETYTPLVDTFVNAIAGLHGMTATDFFSRIEGLKPPRVSGKTAQLVVSHAEAASVPASASAPTLDALETFALDLINKLQELLHAHRARKQLAPSKRDRRPPAARKTKSS